MNTMRSLMSDLKGIGLQIGDSVLVHSSLKSIGKVVGGPVSIILALERTIGEEGTLVMPTFSEHLCDPKDQDGSYTEEERQAKLRSMPAYFPDLTPVDKVNGFLTEVFRKQDGVHRSNHPHVSFAAWGAHSECVVEDHPLENPLDQHSPLGTLYELGAKTLLLGVGGDALTILHLSEYSVPQLTEKRRTWSVKLSKGEGDPWTEYSDVDNKSDYFPGLLADYEKQTGTCSRGQVGEAESKLLPVRELVDFGVGWLSEYR